MDTQKLLHRIRQHVTDTVGFLVFATPTGAFQENVLSGMSDEVSFKSRMIVGGLFLWGLGGILGYGRDLSHQKFNITSETREVYQQMHDMAYLAATTILLNPFIYMAGGSRDVKEIIAGTVIGTISALTIGGGVGYSVDLMRDLTGYEPSARVPQRIREASSTTKKALAAGAVAASLGITGLIYSFTPNHPEDIPKPPTQIEMLEQYVK